MRADFNAFEKQNLRKVFVSNQQASLVLSALPLAYLTKSILLPVVFVFLGTTYRVVKSSDLVNYFRDRELQLDLHKKRQVVLNAIMLQQSSLKIDSL